MLEAFIIGMVEKEVEGKMATIFERNCKTEDLGSSEEQDFIGSWEAQQRGRAQSLAGPSPKALVAFIRAQVERAVEAKLASLQPVGQVAEPGLGRLRELPPSPAADSLRVFFRDLLSHGARAGRGAAGGRDSPSTRERRGRMPGLARATVVLDRYKVMQAEREQSRPRPPAEIAAEGRGARRVGGERSATPLLESAGPAEESRSTPVPERAVREPVPSAQNRPRPGDQEARREAGSGPEERLLPPDEARGREGGARGREGGALRGGGGELCSREKRVEGLNSIRRLAQCHPEMLTPRMHNICLVVVQEVRGLFHLTLSAVCVPGVPRCRGDAGRPVPPPAARHGPGAGLDRQGAAAEGRETSKFIRQDVGVALGHMVRGCNPARCMKALLGGGLSDRNAAIRDCSARQLLVLIETVGVTRLLDFKKELLNNFLSAVCRLPRDASQEVRNCGKAIVQALSAHKELKKKLAKFQ
ncbi:hypothetical protein ANANG_G00075830 [Anguilla anguilla]|uniref:CLASP N-terminal domain-containing protein n=1 Tax=Anguilla anguilla TaxID=7936 RepID=A0A9D3MJ22_ANGAN|nr:hypothetical protein ANANG_G00075830 [Anguilla anguilla]